MILENMFAIPESSLLMPAEFLLQSDVDWCEKLPDDMIPSDDCDVFCDDMNSYVVSSPTNPFFQRMNMPTGLILRRCRAGVIPHQTSPLSKLSFPACTIQFGDRCLQVIIDSGASPNVANVSS